MMMRDHLHFSGQRWSQALLTSSALLCASPALAQTINWTGNVIPVPAGPPQPSPWNVGVNLTVGDTANGTMAISGGGVVSNIQGLIGGAASGTGSVLVTGPGSQWNNSDILFVGYDGSGTLEIIAGGVVSSTQGQIGRNAGSNSSALVTSAGSQWNMSQSLFVGVLGGSTGTLTISGGGVVSSLQGQIGYAAGSTGSVLVSGPGSQWNNMNDNLDIGEGGNGTLKVTAGGIVSSGFLFVGKLGNSSGTLEITAGGGVSSTQGQIGRDAGSTGSVLVSGSGSQWNMSDELFVGIYGGSTGALAIANAGVVSNTNSTIGYAAGGIGTVTVDGSDHSGITPAR